MSAHAKLSPSGAKRWVNCPGSVRLSEGIPRTPSSSYAAEGTVAHVFAEAFASGKMDTRVLMSKVGTVIQEDGQEIEVDDAMVDAAVEYADLVNRDYRSLEEQGGRGVSPVQKFEEKVCAAASISPDLWGRADHYCYKKGARLIVHDFKYGRTAVEAEDNEQLAIYAIAVMDGEAGWVFDKVELVIHQPRASHADGGERRWVTTPAHLKTVAEKLKAAVEATKEKGAKLEPGSWCKFCPAMSSCPAITGKMQSTCEADFSVIPASAGAGELPNPAVLSIEKVAKILLWEDAIDSWLKALRARAIEELQNGREVPFFKLVDGKSNRKWINESEVLARFGGLVAEEKLWKPRELVGPAALEKVVGKGKLDDLTMKPSAGKSLARDTDPRPQTASAVERDFKPIGEQGKALLNNVLDPLAAFNNPLAGWGDPMPPEQKKADPLMEELMGGKSGPDRVWPL